MSSPSQIRVFSNEYGVSYRGSKRRLIEAGLATEDMFPVVGEAWRGNGLHRSHPEPMWSVQRSDQGDFIVTWGLCDEDRTED